MRTLSWLALLAILLVGRVMLPRGPIQLRLWSGIVVLAFLLVVMVVCIVGIEVSRRRRIQILPGLTAADRQRGGSAGAHGTPGGPTTSASVPEPRSGGGVASIIGR
jgi:hypothetical protein